MHLKARLEHSVPAHVSLDGIMFTLILLKVISLRSEKSVE